MEDTNKDYLRPKNLEILKKLMLLAEEFEFKPEESEEKPMQQDNLIIVGRVAYKMGEVFEGRGTSSVAVICNGEIAPQMLVGAMEANDMLAKTIMVAGTLYQRKKMTEILGPVFQEMQQTAEVIKKAENETPDPDQN